MNYGIRGRGKRKPGELNKTEQAYQQHLELRRLAGEIAWYAFEPLKLRLAANTFYTPDFLVMLTDGLLEVHECKGFWEDDARVKIKVAAALYPLTFIAAKRVKGNWEMESF
jgi:hypothetical protein